MSQTRGIARPDRHDQPDRITLTGLAVYAHHGVFEHERVHGQEFIVDLVVEFDMRAAAISDDVADTVDYGALALTVASEVRRDPVNLLETVAERVASAILTDPRIDAVEVTIHKPQAPIETAFADVSVTIRRTAGNAGAAGATGDAR
jgi:dihydroneopterin aldolase